MLFSIQFISPYKTKEHTHIHTDEQTDMIHEFSRKSVMRDWKAGCYKKGEGEEVRGWHYVP